MSTQGSLDQLRIMRVEWIPEDFVFSNVLIIDVNIIVKTYIDSKNQTEPYNSYIDDVIVYLNYFGSSAYEDSLNSALVNMLIINFPRRWFEQIKNHKKRVL